ncbi:hypothetical protein DL771_003590 [Monosporascus sp. 5C6A]|nr:hypothetical protein DL771_003590 [Monosporascus sp. 5C6A]
MGLVHDQYPTYDLSHTTLLSYLQGLFPGVRNISVAQHLDGGQYILKIPRKLTHVRLTHNPLGSRNQPPVSEMASFQDPMAAFLRSKESPDNYPLNLARTEVYQHRLESYVARLKTDQYFDKKFLEKSTDPGKSWPLRQTALYHAFNVRYGHSLWIVLKGDYLMRKRIPKDARQQPDMKPASMTSPARSLVACLHVHLIVLEWSVENWGEFIDYLEEKRTVNTIDARLAPVAEMTSPMQIAQNFSRRGTIDTTVSKQSTFYSQEPSTRRNSGLPSSPTSPTFKRSLSNFFRRASDLQTVQENRLPGKQATEDATAGDADEDASIDFDREFSFDQLQRLSLLGDELEQGIISIEQNKEVLAEIQAQYETVLESPAFKEHVFLEECTGKISTFFRRLRSIKREMDMHLVRLKALSRAIDSNKVVFGAALQHNSEKTSEYFAHSAKVSSDRMEDWTVKMHRIAVKTEQETISMHVITIFTLIFLPGTFLAVRLAAPRLFSGLCTAALTSWQTFFSSGVLDWNDEGLLDSDWVLRSEALKLFLFICVPLMIVIITGWSLMYMVVRRKRKATENATHNGYADEKGMNHESPAGLGIQGQPEMLPNP